MPYVAKVYLIIPTRYHNVPFALFYCECVVLSAAYSGRHRLQPPCYTAGGKRRLACIHSLGSLYKKDRPCMG